MEEEKQSTCSKCHMAIQWIKTENGKNMPANLKEVSIITKDGRTLRGFIPHWVTCQFSDYSNKKKDEEAKKFSQECL